MRGCNCLISENGSYAGGGDGGGGGCATERDHVTTAGLQRRRLVKEQKLSNFRLMIGAISANVCEKHCDIVSPLRPLKGFTHSGFIHFYEMAAKCF